MRRVWKDLRCDMQSIPNTQQKQRQHRPQYHHVGQQSNANLIFLGDFLFKSNVLYMIFPRLPPQIITKYSKPPVSPTPTARKKEQNV